MLLEEIKLHPHTRMKIDVLEKKLLPEEVDLFNTLFRELNKEGYRIKELEDELGELQDDVNLAQNAARDGVDDIKAVLHSMKICVKGEGERSLFEEARKAISDIEDALEYFEDIENIL